MPKISRLFRYPVKSCRGMAVPSLSIDRRGPELDRAWMVVYADNHRMMTQRETRRLALVSPELTGNDLTLRADGHDGIQILWNRRENGQRLTTNVHTDEGLEVVDQGDEVATWLTQVLEVKSRLVWMPESTQRLSRRQQSHGRKVEVGFADGMPLLVISQQSLNDLNRRLAAPIGMERFRPNIVADGCPLPHDEDTWRVFVAGGIEFWGIKLCDRCVITTTDQKTGVRRDSEPLETLATYRAKQKPGGTKRVYFGMNANHAGFGIIRVGDDIQVRMRWSTPPT